MAKQKQIIEEEGKEVSSNDVLGGLLKDYKDDHFSFITSKNVLISTGSLILDSLVKVRSGNVIRLVGKGAELGKSSQCFVFAENYMETMPKSKTLYIKAEGRLGEDIQKRTGQKFVFDAKDWIDGTIYVFSCNVFEVVAQIIETLLKSMYENGEHLCVCIDSLDGIILKADKEKDIWGGKESPKVAGVPLLTKLLFRRLALPIQAYDALLLITGQYSADIKLDPYSPNVPRQVESAGGNSIAHQSDYVFSYGPRFGGDLILKNPDEKPDSVKNPIIGVYATIEIKKSTTDVSGTKVKIPIKKGVVGNAIWRSKEVADMILMWGLAVKAGAWITFKDSVIKQALEDNIKLNPKVNGLNALYTYLDEDSEVCGWFFNQFKNLSS